MQLYLMIAAAVVLMVIFVLYRRARKADESGGALTALVFLMSKARILSEQQVRDAIVKAWGIELGSEMRTEGNWLVEAGKVDPGMVQPGAKNFLVRANDRMFLINSVDHPYMENPEQFAKSMPDLRLRTAVGSHRAWNSVDLFGETPAPHEKEEVYTLLGKLLAEFAGEECLAVYCPEIERCNEYAPSVVESLRSGKIFDLFEFPTHSPIVQIDGDDPRMVAAVEEARRRWPEFNSAFQKRKSEEEIFAVKARFAEGDEEEFMWVAVENINGDSITGTLGNSPAIVKKVKEGDTVTVKLSDLNDWLYGKEDKMEGGFTMKVMEEAMKKAK